MASGAVVGDWFGGSACAVVAVVTAKAARRAGVAEIVDPRLPIYLHLGKDILRVKSGELQSRSMNGVTPGRILGSVIFPVKEFQLKQDSLPRNLARCKVHFEDAQGLAVDIGELRIYTAICHGTIQGFFRSLVSMGGAIVAVCTIHLTQLAERSFAGQSGCSLYSLFAITLRFAHPGNHGARVICANEFDVAHVCAMNAGQLPQGILAAHMHLQNRFGLRVRLIIGKAVFYDESVAEETRTRVATFTDFVCRTKAFNRRRNRRGIAVQDDLKELADAIEFGIGLSTSTGADMAFGTGDVGVCRVEVCDMLGLHDMAGTAAKTGAFHVSRTTIPGIEDDKEIDAGGGQQHDQRLAIAAERMCAQKING